jgi:CRP-like cAMP-binding protein
MPNNAGGQDAGPMQCDPKHRETSMSNRESGSPLSSLSPINRLLASLRAPELDRIKRELTPVSWKADHILLDRMDPIRYVWFPDTCVVSLTVALEDGITCEAGIIGADGIVGYEAFLGNNTALSRHVVQIGGIALQLPLKTARALFETSPAFHDLVLNYVSALHAETLQSVACHGLHSGRVRLARLLLQIQDRTHGNPMVNLTHEMMANVLGVQRTTVTAAALELQEEGLIAYRRGRIEIRHRDGLEHSACECYGTIRANFDRLLPQFSRAALPTEPRIL